MQEGGRGVKPTPGPQLLLSEGITGRQEAS